MAGNEAVAWKPRRCPRDGTLMTERCVCEGCDAIREIMADKQGVRAKHLKLWVSTSKKGKKG